MNESNPLDSLNDEHKMYSALAGLTHAVQSLATVVLDDETKREKVSRLLDHLSEAALHSSLTQDRLQEYLIGLGALGIASETSKNWHQPGE